MNNEFFEQCCAACTEKNCAFCISNTKRSSKRRKNSSYTDKYTAPEEGPGIENVT